MSTKCKIIHIKSKQHGDKVDMPKLPGAEQLVYGELAINYGKDIETIAIKNEKDEIIKFIPENKVEELIEKRINEKTKEILDTFDKKLKDFGFSNLNDSSIDSGEY